MLDPYKELGVKKDAIDKIIRKVYLKKVKTMHPDAGGDPEAFKRLKEAYELLMDPERRARYDETGRTDRSSVTSEKIATVISRSIGDVLEASAIRDVVYQDVLKDILEQSGEARRIVTQQQYKTDRKLERLQRMIERFKRKAPGDDVVGAVLNAHRKKLEAERAVHQDALELALAVERVLAEYKYEVGPGPEGQYSPGPTTRELSSAGSRLLDHR